MKYQVLLTTQAVCRQREAAKHITRPRIFGNPVVMECAVVDIVDVNPYDDATLYQHVFNRQP